VSKGGHHYEAGGRGRNDPGFAVPVSCVASVCCILSLTAIPGTPLYNQEKLGRFELPNHIEILHELRLMVANVDVIKGQFQANHASNYLPINCRLPRDKQKILAMINEALTGQRSLRPDFLRAL